MNAKQVTLTNVRLAFPALNEPERFQGEGNPRYSATLIFPAGSAQEEACVKAIMAAAKEKWADKAQSTAKALLNGNKTALGSGDAKADYDGFEGNMYVSAHARPQNPPRLVDRQRNDLARDTSMIYAGCYVNAGIEFWAQDNQFGKRINAQIRWVQFVKDGDAFGSAGTKVSDAEIEVLDAEDELM